MVFNFKLTRPKKSQNLIDTQEAFNLWDILSTKYAGSKKLQVWETFAHDEDLKLLIKFYLTKFSDHIALLEKEIIKYKVKAPIVNIKGINSPVNPELVHDQFIAKDIFLLLQGHIENLLRSMRSSMTNDDLRATFYKMTKETIDRSDRVVHYLKLKGWIETPPLYHDTPKEVTEKLTTCEAYQLWDHLIFRYDNIRQTQIFESFAFDGDFKIVLKTGLKELQKQAQMLEKELLYFGIPLPIKPSDLVVPPDNTELLDDDFMFRTIFLGIQGATIIHAQSLKEATFNDRLRNIFKDLLLDEIKIYDSLVKFGKVKGWVHSVPSYRET